MSAERIIGIDFGTSTSVVRVKRYQGGKPLGDDQMVLPVTFNMGSTVTPTLIQKVDDHLYYGFDAQVPRRKAELFQNFKVELESGDPERKRRARELTQMFLAYLGNTYRAQSDGGHLGEADDAARTLVSYPVKWSDETKRFMVEAARKAGFPNVEGTDEANAAIQAVTVQNADYLMKRGYFRKGAPVNILLIDMGAGTTDLVLCRHAPGTGKTEILSTWPKGGDLLFGGKEVDELLLEHVRFKLPPEEADVVLRRCGLDKFKSWKETMVSPALGKNAKVSEFSELDNIVDLLEIDTGDYSIDRAAFEAEAADYLRKLPLLVNGCLKAAKMNGSDVDLVILTGGHSQWYFVREMLSGKLVRFGKTALEKIEKDPGRVINVALPQETVALGLAFSPLRVALLEPETGREGVAVQAKTMPVSMTMPYSIENAPKLKDHLSFERCGMGHVINLLTLDGDLYILNRAQGWNYKYDDWTDIKMLRCLAREEGRPYRVALKRNGTVVFDVWAGDRLERQLETWRDIVSIDGELGVVWGLRRDGTLIKAAKNQDQTEVLTDLGSRFTALAASSINSVMGTRDDGTLRGIYIDSTTKAHKGTWEWDDILSASCGGSHAVGLRKDGTVAAKSFQKDVSSCHVQDWRDIVSVGVAGSATVGLRSDGTIALAGARPAEMQACAMWKNVVKIACDGPHVVGLRGDGTVLTTMGQHIAADWQDIVDVFVCIQAYSYGAEHFIVGLKRDGSIIYSSKRLENHLLRRSEVSVTVQNFILPWKLL